LRTHSNGGFCVCVNKRDYAMLLLSGKKIHV
jgi:hypothetical protein